MDLSDYEKGYQDACKARAHAREATTSQAPCRSPAEVDPAGALPLGNERPHLLGEGLALAGVLGALHRREHSHLLRREVAVDHAASSYGMTHGARFGKLGTCAALFVNPSARYRARSSSVWNPPTGRSCHGIEIGASQSSAVRVRENLTRSA